MREGTTLRLYPNFQKRRGPRREDRDPAGRARYPTTRPAHVRHQPSYCTHFTYSVFRRQGCRSDSTHFAVSVRPVVVRWFASSKLNSQELGLGFAYSLNQNALRNDFRGFNNSNLRLDVRLAMNGRFGLRESTT